MIDTAGRKERKEESWKVLDHICRECGGRILQGTFPAATGGGNPIYRCSNCSARGSSISPDILCWCGFHFKGQISGGEYMCILIDPEELRENPWLKDALAHSGHHVGKEQVGVIVRALYKQAMSQTSQNKLK